MSRISNCLLVAGGLALAVLCGSASPARAQRVANPYAMFGPTFVSPYWGYSYDPYGLHGAADVIRAQGQLMMNQQQAFLMKEQVRSARLDNRRKDLEQWLWERENLPTPEDDRARYLKEQLRRSRNDPPITEIWSAKALNDLLLDAQKIRRAGVKADAPPLSPEMLAKINVTTGKSGGNLGLLKDGKITWPLLLRSKREFEKDREHLNHLVSQAYRQAVQGQIEADVLVDMQGGVTDMRQLLSTMARSAGDQASWTPTMYFDATSFLNQFDDAIKVLQQPDAAHYILGAYAAKGRTVAELVAYMAEHGLRFAPATAGSESAYTALHKALAEYDTIGGTELRTKER
jgi:hypothetical protein